MQSLCVLLDVFVWIILARLILGFFPTAGGVVEQLREITVMLTEWIMGPLRRLIPPVRLGASALDLSPLLLILGIQLLQAAVC